MDNNRVDWSDLPKELWPLIAKHINTKLDLLRFRSCCNSWRSAIPLSPTSSHSLFPPQTIIPLRHFSLLQTKIYRLQPSHQDPSLSSSKGWIIKIGESKSLPLPLLDPFTNKRLSPTSPKLLNLINFRFLHLLEAYSLYHATCFSSEDEDQNESGLFRPVLKVRKVVLFPSFPRMVFVLYKDGKLCVSKIGHEDWTVLDDGNSHYDDIILHKGQVYVVDKWGTILWINCSSFKVVQFSPMLCGFGKRKHMVENGGSLYVVDMYIEGEPDNLMGMYYEVVDVKVYKLDEEWGRWLDVKDLGDVLFVLGKDCNFSLSAQDYYGCEGNCVYFYSEGRARAFTLGNSKFKSPNIFWPCPTLFHPKFNL